MKPKHSLNHNIKSVPLVLTGNNAHSWAFGTTTHTRTVSTTGVLGDLVRTKSRDLQIGRFLFGITQRISDRASLNWSIEIGATDDATDARSVLRIPLILLFGR
jgi:hypothetical protein